MANSVFDRDTLLDITVNVIPLCIILFFLGVYLALNPWGTGFMNNVSIALLVAPFIGLAYLTYIAAKKIEG